jgi:hypothetical protein
MAGDNQKNSTAGERLIVGWREHVALPEWGIKAIKAKIDTGARTSAIHVDNIQHLSSGRVRFDVIVGHRGGERECVPVEADLLRMSRIRSSAGREHERPVVKTRVRLGPVEREIELSLVCRHGMLCRMLLGRTALAEDFLVDPAATRLLSPRRNKSSPSPRRSRA